MPPPPYTKYEEKEKNKLKEFYKGKDSTASGTEKDVAANQQFGNKPIKDPSIIQESVVIALNPPPFHQQKQHAQPQHNFYNNYPPINKEPTIDVQVTKEKLNHFQNNVPQNYNPQEFNLEEYLGFPKPAEVELNLPTYEVTEGKFVQEPQVIPVYSTHIPSYKQEENVVKKPSEADLIKPFLPTPVIPGGASPTSPTQSEVSEIYSFMKNKQEDFFSIKEVSTHYPILGTPAYQDFDAQFINDVTPKSTEETPTIPTTEKLFTQRRPGQRRRRPINKPRPPTTQEPVAATEIDEPQKTQLPDPTSDIIRQRPQRRKPIRYRTTEAPESNEEAKPVRTRQRIRTRPTAETTPNHKANDEETSYYINRRRPENIKPIYETEELKETNDETDYNKFESEEVKPARRRKRPNFYQEIEEIEKTTENHEIVSHAQQITTEKLPSTFFKTPENEIDFSTFKPVNDINIQEIPETENDDITLATTTPTTTTSTTTTTTTTTTTEAPTTTTTTTKATRRRPINYNASRPRFSVKDYRQRLSQYSSTTTTTTETSHVPRNRLPNRIRKPLRTTPQPHEEPEQEELTDIHRQRFKPKDPRFRAQINSNNNEETITDKQINKVNTRVRPFNRHRSTTEPTTTTAKVSIKPNLFNNRRRPPPISLKAKIASKYQKETTTDEATTQIDENLELQKVESTSFENAIDRMDTTTPTTEPEVSSTVSDEDDATDISRNESIMYSQRVSDLTSSAQKEYDTPGLFKNVAPTSRRVPNYFTIATDDPILPIEAFFPNLKDKEKDS